MLALAMYISCFLCRFHLRLVPNANPISGGIWALHFLTFSVGTFICEHAIHKYFDYSSHGSVCIELV